MIDKTAALQAIYTVSQAVRLGFSLREAVFDFFADAKRFEEDSDGDMGDTGHMIDLTVYHITVTHETLRELVEALGVKYRDNESPYEALKKEMVL